MADKDVYSQDLSQCQKQWKLLRNVCGMDEKKTNFKELVNKCVMYSSLIQH